MWLILACSMTFATLLRTDMTSEAVAQSELQRKKKITQLERRLGDEESILIRIGIHCRLMENDYEDQCDMSKQSCA